MKKIYLTSLISSAILLSACSGGGGSSTPQVTIPSVTTPSQNQNNAAQPAQQTPQKSSDTKPTTAAPSTSSPKVNDTSKVNLPVTTINRTDFKPGAFKNVDAGIGKISGFNQKYSFNGAWADIKDPNILETAGKRLILANLTAIPFSDQAVDALWNAFKNSFTKTEREVFYGGIETNVSKIPTSGKRIYTGHAARYDNVTSSVKNIGKSELVADFYNKKRGCTRLALNFTPFPQCF